VVLADVDAAVEDKVEAVAEVGNEKPGAFNLQTTHGKMKYLGSTNGAVTRLSAVAANQMRNQLVLGPCSCLMLCSLRLRWISARIFRAAGVTAMFLLGREEGGGGARVE